MAIQTPQFFQYLNITRLSNASLWDVIRAEHCHACGWPLDSPETLTTPDNSTTPVTFPSSQLKLIYRHTIIYFPTHTDWRRWRSDECICLTSWIMFSRTLRPCLATNWWRFWTTETGAWPPMSGTVIQRSSVYLSSDVLTGGKLQGWCDLLACHCRLYLLL